MTVKDLKNELLNFDDDLNVFLESEFTEYGVGIHKIQVMNLNPNHHLTIPEEDKDKNCVVIFSNFN